MFLISLIHASFAAAERFGSHLSAIPACMSGGVECNRLKVDSKQAFSPVFCTPRGVLLLRFLHPSDECVIRQRDGDSASAHQEESEARDSPAREVI
jgi:hypothetical protein